MKRILPLLAVVALFPGCATKNAAKLINALKNDPAGFTLNVDTLYGKVHLVRANPNSNTPPYTLSPDGTVRVLESNRDAVLTAAPPVTRDDVLLQTLRKIPNPPEVQ